MILPFPTPLCRRPGREELDPADLRRWRCLIRQMPPIRLDRVADARVRISTLEHQCEPVLSVTIDRLCADLAD